MRRLLGILEIMLPLAILLASGVFIMATLSYVPEASTTEARPMPATTPVTGTPATLTIPTLDLSLTVRKGEYNPSSQAWTLNATDVFINAEQPLVSNRSDAPLAFIYGHNTDAVLGRTIRLKPGDVLTIDTSDGRQFVYRFTRAFVVEPSNMDVITDTSRGQLALLSCDGLLDQRRRVMYFSFERVDAR